MTQYMILLYDDEANWDDEAVGTADWDAEMARHVRFAEQIRALGASIVESNALRQSPTATSIRGDIVTDGPFVETKEMLGGYYVIEAADLDQAIEIGKLCPVGPDGGVEVRPILDTGSESS